MFEPLDFLQVALDLAERSNRTEAHIRTAIGRSYYAVHLKALWGLERRGLFEPNADASDHGRVISTLRLHRRNEAADELRRLRRLRDIADYRINVEIVPADWLSAKESAEKLVFLLTTDWT